MSEDSATQKLLQTPLAAPDRRDVMIPEWWEKLEIEHGGSRVKDYDASRNVYVIEFADGYVGAFNAHDGSAPEDIHDYAADDVIGEAPAENERSMADVVSSDRTYDEAGVRDRALTLSLGALTNGGRAIDSVTSLIEGADAITEYLLRGIVPGRVDPETTPQEATGGPLTAEQGEPEEPSDPKGDPLIMGEVKWENPDPGDLY